MPLQFDSYLSKANEMINRLSSELEVPRDQSARILRSTLKALRNQLTLEENFDLLSQLPMLIKAIYVDGWNPTKNHKTEHKIEDFLNDIRTYDSGAANYDFGNNLQAYHIVKAVFRVLREYVSAGEWEDIKAVVSKPLKKLFIVEHEESFF